MNRIDAALVYARQLHSGQVRKGTQIPYVSHLLAVASLVLEAGGGEDEAIAALLHDAVEDQGGSPTLAVIRERFGETVAGIVEGCTDTYVVPKPPWRARKEAYVHHLRRAAPAVRLVSLADKLHNARAIVSDLRRHGHALWDRFNGGRDGTLWYYRAVADALEGTESAWLVEELQRVVDEMDRLNASTGKEVERTAQPGVAPL